METNDRMDIRSAARQRRQAPAKPVSLFVGFGEGGQVEDIQSPATIDLTLEATGRDAEFAEWLDDIWWMDLIGRWEDDRVVVHVAPTPGALLHPVVLHQFEMLRRVAPRWRLVGYGYLSDLRMSGAVERLARSAYDEVHFYDAVRPGANRLSNLEVPAPLAKLFGDVRSVQKRLGLVRPVLVRLPSGTPEPSAAASSREVVSATTPILPSTYR